MKTLTLKAALCLLAPLVTVATVASLATVANATPSTCRSWQGMEVPYLGDQNLDNVGGATFDNAGRAIITLNPTRLSQFPPLAREFWLAHTCGHHALTPQYNTEQEADCFAMRSLGKKKIRTPEKRETLFEELKTLPADVWGDHQPDAARIDALRQCKVED